MAKAISYWENRLRGEAALLSSLVNFMPEFMSLKKPHPIWLTAGSNPYEISKAIQQAKFLSGRYRTEVLAKHWTKNKSGFCQSSSCISVVEQWSISCYTAVLMLAVRSPCTLSGSLRPTLLC